jgi:anti-sigma B factor antagonist
MIDFEVTTTEDGVGVIAPAGRFNMVSARRFKEVVAELVADGRSRIVVDLGGTTFLDSSGLGAIIAGLKACRQAGGDLRIARPTPEVLTVFELTNMDKVLKPRDDVGTAFDV